MAAKKLGKIVDEVDVINKKIIKIFKKHKVKPGSGEEAFYHAVKKVATKSKSDAKKLEKLAQHWAVQMSFNYTRSGG